MPTEPLPPSLPPTPTGGQHHETGDAKSAVDVPVSAEDGDEEDEDEEDEERESLENRAFVTAESPVARQ